jgi:siroheme synthase-like protein
VQSHAARRGSSPVAERASSGPPEPSTFAAGEPAPLFHLALKLEGRPCLVVGGGPVGARKAASLVASGAIVTVVSPELCEDLADLPVRLERRRYRPGEAAGYRLVIAATGDPSIDGQVYADADGAGVFVNAADDPAACSFYMPAVTRVGPVSVGVSTAGVSPWLAGWVKRRVAAALPEQIAVLAEIVGDARTAIRAAGLSSEGLDWSGLVDGSLWPLLEAGDADKARSVAAQFARDAIAGS